MKKLQIIASLFGIIIILIISLSCNNEVNNNEVKIIFLHHSTGSIIWNGRSPNFIQKAIKKLNPNLSLSIFQKPHLLSLFKEYNHVSDKNVIIEEMTFPKSKPYGWNNFPYDYYNIWVKNAGVNSYMNEPTLEILTKSYDILIFKHCFPVSNIQNDLDSADINSNYRSISNYKLQYLALRSKLHEFPNNKFILFTGAALVKANVSEESAKRAHDFFKWVNEEWDLPNDNIFIWDLYNLQTEGGLYFKDEYAISPLNSHPNSKFAAKASKLLFDRIVEIIDNE